eukprot:427016-Rhodomonas_salina.1
MLWRYQEQERGARSVLESDKRKLEGSKVSSAYGERARAYPSPFTLHPSPVTRHPSPFLHPSPFTLHPSPFTLHPLGVDWEVGRAGGGGSARRARQGPAEPTRG